MKRPKGRSKRIEIAFGTPRKKVTATVFGIWAAHRCPERDLRGKGWRVTHVPSGWALLSRSDGLSRADAMRVARLLAERVPVIDHRASTREDGHIIDAAFGEVLGS